MPLPLIGVPADLERVITRALSKDPDERIQSMKDLALELRAIGRSYDSLRMLTSRRLKLKHHRGSWIGIAAAALIVGGLTGYVLNDRESNAEPIRFAISPRAEFGVPRNDASAGDQLRAKETALDRNWETSRRRRRRVDSNQLLASSFGGRNVENRVRSGERQPADAVRLAFHNP